MSYKISTNIQSLSAQRSLSETRRSQAKTFAQLSSGSRINKAGDDAAGLAISEKLKAHIRGTRQAHRNAGDGVSLVQTAEGGLSEVHNILIRLRELSVQSASDTLSESERSFSNMEFQELKKEVERIADSTSFNDKSLLNGEGDQMEFQIGIYNNETQDRIRYNPQDTSVKADNIGIDGLDVSTKVSSQNNLIVLDKAMDKVSQNRANLGALQNRLQAAMRGLEVKGENLSAANSRIRDTDIAEASAQLAKDNILSASSTSVLAQANQSSAGALNLI